MLWRKLELDVLFKISIVLVAGIIGGKVAKILKLPNVSGYLVAGLFLGPTFFRLISSQDGSKFSIISELALGIIAFSIGSEFVVKEMMKVGKAIFIITLAEVVGAIAVVFSIMFFLCNQEFAFSIVIASMSAATAPAATLLVMKQYRAHGPLTKTVLPVVALDDVFGIAAFGIAMSLAIISIGNTETSLFKMISGPFIEIIGSGLLGLMLGLILTFITKKTKDRDESQVISLTAIGIAIGLSNLLHLSPLLTSIMMGATLANLHHRPQQVFSSLNDFASPVYVLFFTLAGASLDLAILKSIGIIGVAYIFARAAGKMLGGWLGAVSVKAEKTVVKYLGLTLLPQGGVSIGLSVLVRQQLPEYLAVNITTIIMASVLVYEVSGPIFAKIAIQKAGEVNGLDKIYESEALNKIEEVTV